jgi:energy-coupling factor transporter ATP-binding protein EcfA2
VRTGCSQLVRGREKLVSLATVLSTEQKILLLDESRSGLDNNTNARLMEAFSQLNPSFIWISRGIFFIPETTDSIIEMREGKKFLAKKCTSIPITTDILMVL